MQQVHSKQGVRLKHETVRYVLRVRFVAAERGAETRSGVKATGGEPEL